MATTQHECIRCGVLFAVPQGTQTIKCRVCQSVTLVQPNNNLGRNTQSANKVKGFINSMLSVRNDRYMPATYGYGYYSQPISPPYSVPPRGLGSTSWRRRAVLCGINYYGSYNNLKGCINDVMCMRSFLVEKWGFSIDSILVLTEEERDPYRMPTKYNIQMALRWLVQDCQSGDSLVFYFSGHGSHQPQFYQNEKDGLDEYIIPLDHERSGVILDDDINAIIVRPLPRGVKLHAIVDSCFSGTILDLPYIYRLKGNINKMWKDHTKFSKDYYKGTSGGLAISISACTDHQTAEEKPSNSIYFSTGVMTQSLIKVVRNEPYITYGCLLNAMYDKINSPIWPLVGKASCPEQKPQLSSSETFDVYSIQFTL